MDADNLKYAATQLEVSIEKAWSGTYVQNGITFTVQVEIDAQAYTSEDEATKSGAQNVLEITNGPTMYDEKGNPVPGYINPGWEAADTGKLDFNKLRTRTPEHEFGHLLGVDDRSSGYYLMNNRLNQGSDYATAYDYGWAFGGAINSHRLESRPVVNSGRQWETLSSGGSTRGAPRSYTSTRELRAAKIFWR